jgi:hypothetical protein
VGEVALVAEISPVAEVILVGAEPVVTGEVMLIILSYAKFPSMIVHWTKDEDKA